MAPKRRHRVPSQDPPPVLQLFDIKHLVDSVARETRCVNHLHKEEEDQLMLEPWMIKTSGYTFIHLSEETVKMGSVSADHEDGRPTKLSQRSYGSLCSKYSMPVSCTCGGAG